MGRERVKSDTSGYPQALGKIASSLNSPLPLRQTFHLALRSAAKAMNVSGCALMLLDSSGRNLLPIASYKLSEWYVKKGILDVDKSMGETMNGGAVAVLDAGRDPRVQYGDMAERAGIESIVSVPVKDKSRVIGVFRAYSHERRRFTKGEIGFLNIIADMCGIALQNARPLERSAGEGVVAEEVDKLSPDIDTGRLASELRKPVNFAHRSEEEFVRLLDFYRIEWLYEPRSFPLEWDGRKVIEMFTPDFYLPEFDLYIEITTMKQNLATEKNRKVRLLRRLYPDVAIKLLNRRGFSRLLTKYGYGLKVETEGGAAIRMLISSAQIQRKVKSLGKIISQDYAGKRLVLVGILKGVVPFLSDLMRNISLDLSVEVMSVSYYSEDALQAVRITKDLDSTVTGLDVLMVEDIVDTGMTLNYALNHLRSHNPASLRVCALLDKRASRLVGVPLDYVGFDIPDEFVVGYGLDHLAKYRNLPFIGTLSQERSMPRDSEEGIERLGVVLSEQYALELVQI